MKKIFFDEQGNIGTVEGETVLPLDAGEKLICTNEQAAEFCLADGQWIDESALRALLTPTLPQAKSQAKFRARSHAESVLALTDYKVLRQSEQATLSDDDYAALKAERQAVRDACNALEASVDACTTVAEVLALVPNVR